MRSLMTWALAAAVALIALAATVDALRVESGTSEAAPVRTVVPPPRQPCPRAITTSFRGEGGVIPCPRRTLRRLAL